MELVRDKDFVGGTAEVQLAFYAGVFCLRGALDVARDATSVAADGFEVDGCGEDFYFFLGFGLTPGVEIYAGEERRNSYE